jgi:nitrogen-specific signal transduction histidine kinase/CheY-like chemotaxis protein
VAERTEALVEAHRALERQEQGRQHARKIEALGRLAGGVAHDFNNLLTAVHGYANLLLDDLPEGDPRREDVLEIRRAGERASALTRQLLTFSRRDVVQARVLDPNRVVAELERMLRRLIREDVTLALELEPGAGPVRMDPGHLEQIVVNLVVNARDAMPRGGRIQLRTRNVVRPGPDTPRGDAVPDGRWMLLSVEDQGTGMDPETLANAFEPFFTTKPDTAGTGLGLATVQAVARQSGGHVFADSAAGAGSIFRVWLPIAEGAPAQEAAPVEPGAGAPGATPPVLVAEDDELVRRFVCSVLREAGHDVVSAVDGAEALAALERPDCEAELLVTDLVMPGMDGHQLAVKARERRPGLKVLFMSGYAQGPDLRERVAASGDAFLQKPFSARALVETVRELVRGGRSVASPR